MSSKSGSDGDPNLDPRHQDRRRWSLAARLTAWYASLSFVSIALATFVLYLALSRNLDQGNNRLLRDKIHVLSSILRERPQDTEELRFEVQSAARQQVRGLIRILNPDGTILVEAGEMTRELPPSRFSAVAPSDSNSAPTGVVDGDSGRRYRVMVADTVVPGHDGGTQIQVALDLTQEDEFLATYRIGVWIVLGAALATCLVGGYWIARRGMRPVARIRECVDAIRSSTLNERISTTDLPSDLAGLADTLNGMLARLEDSFQRISRLSADVAHELRTPVSTLRASVEVSLGQSRTADEYRAALEANLDDCMRLAKTIDSVLFLARADNRLTPLHREAVRVRSELLAIRDLYGGLAAESGVALRCEASEDLVLHLDRSLFQRALCNLVENSLKHTERGGELALAAWIENGEAGVTVEDTGSGIPQADMARVFEPFYRVDASRSSESGGAGLGLAIVKGIMTLHGGRVEMESVMGQGTRVRLAFSSDGSA